MRVNGIIAEYNPFHNGHLYQLQQSKQATGSEYTIVVMSGNFTQRGELAFCEKHLRAKMALQNGADLVLELPAVYATSSAGEFAFGGVSLLNSLGVVTDLSFGSECGDIEILTKLSEILSEETPTYQASLADFTSAGDSYPVARSKAIQTILKEDLEVTDKLLRHPNNILALEYLLTLKALHSPITPHTLKRIGSDYHEETLREGYSSATALRKALSETNDRFSLINQMPDSALSLLDDSTGLEYQRIKELLSGALFQKLFWEKDKGYTEYLDVTEGLSDRIRNQLPMYESFDQFSLSLKTKEMTLARIRRSLLHIVLNIQSRETMHIRSPRVVPYARVLGFRREAQPLLSSIKLQSSIPLITKPADACKLLTEEAYVWFQQDINISQFYLGLLHQVRGGKPLNEYTIPIVIES